MISLGFNDLNQIKFLLDKNFMEGNVTYWLKQTGNKAYFMLSDNKKIKIIMGLAVGPFVGYLLH